MRRLDTTRVTATIQTAVTVALGGIGGSAGFIHTHEWATAHGQHGWLAWADAVVIEGMAVVAGFEIHRDRHAGRSTGRVSLPQVVLVVAFLVQMAAQVALAERSVTGWLLAAMPALGFLTVVKLVMRRIPDQSGEPSTPTPHVAMAPTPASPPPGRPVSAVVDRLPASVRQSVLTVAGQARQDGRQITVEEIRRTIRLPESMLANLVAELNTTINNGFV